MNKENSVSARKNTPSKTALMIKAIGFLFKNVNTLKMITAQEELHGNLIRANTEISKLDRRDPLYSRRVAEFNQGVIDLMQCKWYSDVAAASQRKEDWKKAFAALKHCQRLSRALLKALLEGSTSPIPFLPAHLSSQGSEIIYADDVPMVPEINPVIVLQGSDYELGYQYAQQASQIFGPAVMRRKSGRASQFNEEDRAELRRWEEQLRLYAPELIDMIRGWADGATHSGVPLSYEDVLDIWTGHIPPAEKYLGKGVLPTEMPPLACSGVAAWGSATRDGRLVTGSSGDHDCTHMVTLVVYPQTGNNFIFSSFTAHGDIPIVGNLYMMGHPGMNSKGLAYVHHGGVPKLAEPQEEWGYGIRRGASIFHTLRFANSAAEARDMELNYPVGDAGKDSAGTAGGFYADSHYACILEARGKHPIIREAGVLGEVDFLYANNSANHPEIGNAPWMQKHRANWQWEKQGGWRPIDFKPPVLISAKKKDSLDHTNSVMQLMYANSYWRNRFFFDQMNRHHGQIDFETMKSIYRISGRLPDGSWKEKEKAYKQRGEWGEPVTGHAGNALVAVMKPDENGQGVYALCTGPAARGLTAHAPRPHSGPLYNETNAFWELTLASTPQEMCAIAARKAQTDIEIAGNQLDMLVSTDALRPQMETLLAQAKSHFSQGQALQAQAFAESGREAVLLLSHALREFTRAQVRAQQVIQTD